MFRKMLNDTNEISTKHTKTVYMWKKKQSNNHLSSLPLPLPPGITSLTSFKRFFYKKKTKLTHVEK